MRKMNRTGKTSDVSELMNEVGRELGVDETTRRAPGGPQKFAQRLKQAIRKRAR
jgi:hypothetical protein